MWYDFSELDDKEFEQISCDLLSIVFQKPIETFKQWKDGWIDGRFFSDSGEKVAIQCKLYIKTPFSTLIRNLKN